MKHRNRICILLTCAALMLFMAVPAFAVNYPLNDGTCEFDGDSLNANYDDGTLVDRIAGLEPGDSLEYTVTYSNDSDVTVDYYMLAKTLQTLEQSKDVAENGGYRFVLKDIGPNGETVLFDNSKVGGDTVIANLKGLQQATNATQEYFHINQLKPGQSAKTYLRVEFEEETQANDYMDTIGDLRIAYAVELSPTKGDVPDKKTYENHPKTGDTTDILKYILMMTAAVLVGLLAFISWRKDRKGDEKA